MRGLPRTATLLLPAAACSALLLGLLPATTGRAATQLSPATLALIYLQSQQSSQDGSLNQGDFFSSELYAIGAAAAGYDPKVLRAATGPSVIDFLSVDAASACPAATDPHPSAGRCGSLIQAALAAARNPRSFAGLDLVGRLAAYYRPATGGYGDQAAFTQALSMQGLVAAGAAVPPLAVTFVNNAQDGDGGWNFKALKNDPSGSDTNSTAMLLMALDAAGDHSRDASALTWLHSQQNADGGFAYQTSTAAPAPSDPDSTALVLQAIIAAGQSPRSAAWTKSGNNPGTELLRTQDPAGGYAFPGSSAPDAFTTAQVPPALDGVAYPVPFRSHAFYRPGTQLPGLTYPTATPSLSVSPSPGAGVEAVSTPAVPATGASPSTPSALLAALAVAGIGLTGAAIFWRRTRPRM